MECVKLSFEGNVSDQVLFLSADWILAILTPAKNATADLPVNYQLWDLVNKEFISTTSMRETADIIALQPFRKAWSGVGEPDRKYVVVAENINLFDFNCLKVKEIAPDSDSLEEYAPYHLVASLSQFLHLYDSKKALPYLPINRLALDSQYPDYQLDLCHWIERNEPMANEGQKRTYIKKLVSIEKDTFPRNTVDKILAKAKR